jgi:eukaryotic-like serine/threonine-protein kinase
VPAVAEGGTFVRPHRAALLPLHGTAAATADALGEPSRRLALAALSIAAAYAVSLGLMGVLSAAGWPGTPHAALHNAIGAAVVAVSAGVSWAAAGRRLSSAALVHLGLAYEVIVGLGISLQDNLGPVSLGRPLQNISWLAVLIVLFPLVVPSPPGRTLAASLVTASMWPLAFYVGVRLGNPLPPAPDVALNFLENYIAAALALVPTRIVRTLASEVQKARRMGSYELIELLGQGGMGEVWRARHNMLARPAAIKLVRAQSVGLAPGAVHESVRRRFEREAQATAALHSPHTVELYDFGVTADGTFYYVMEILDGLDLEQLVRRFGPVSPARAVHLLLQLCDSLADAHAAGLVHRDVKPANVYACRKGLKHDFVKLLDFGLVKAAWREDGDDLALTQEGSVPGTPAYLAPEVALGEGAVDGRADLYAAGCVAYWLLTGLRVFEAATPLQMALQHALAAPMPPSQRTGRSFPSALEAIVMRCLEKDPAARPPSASELARSLAATGLAGEWTEEEALQWWRAHVPA